MGGYVGVIGRRMGACVVARVCVGRWWWVAWWWWWCVRGGGGVLGCAWAWRVCGWAMAAVVGARVDALVVVGCCVVLMGIGDAATHAATMPCVDATSMDIARSRARGCARALGRELQAMVGL